MIALALVAALAIGGILQLGVLKQYQKDRLTHVPGGAERGRQLEPARANPYAATIEYNLDESKAAIADGGLGGKGLFKGLETNLSYVPNQSTDFIFTAVAEQFGFAGSALLLALFVFVIWRSWRAAVTVARPGRDADLRGGAEHAGVPGVREHRHDDGHHARRRHHLAFHELLAVPRWSSTGWRSAWSST